jgi:ribosomal-protein-alanine N-acetyltransferase
MCAESRQREQTPLVVAPCRKENLPQIHALLEASPEAAAWSPVSLVEMFKSYPPYFLLGWQGEEIAGFIAGRKVREESEILNLAVKPHFRRRGVGKALVEGLLEVFTRESVRQVFLEVRESNRPAITFYQGLGFQKVGKRRAYYREPEEAGLVLARTLWHSSKPGTS